MDFESNPMNAGHKPLTRRAVRATIRGGPSRPALARSRSAFFLFPAPLWLCGSLLFQSTGCAPAYRPDQAMEYPAALRVAGEADIQAYRREERLSITNTSARDFSGARLWLNREYSLVLERFAVGDSLDLALDTFRNEYGEAFRAGGFFAVDPPSNIASAELQTPDGLVAIQVIAGAVERKDQGLSDRRRERETRR